MSSSVKNSRILKVTGNADSQQSHGSNNEDCKEDLGDPNDPRIRLKRDCVGIMGAFRLLKYSDTDHIFIIANTHIDWDPECIDVKLAQAKYLIQCIGRFKTRISEVFHCKPSVIVTGNFASTPGDQVYNYLTSVPIVECPEPDKSLDKLTSFYASSPAGEPKFTTFTSEFKGTLDYIFYSPCGGVLQPIGLLEVPGADFPTMKRIEGLPTLQHPSDHLPIGAVFEIPTRIRKLSQA